KSTQQVFCYEGTLTGSRQGTFNAIKVSPARGDTSDGSLTVIARFDQDTLYTGHGVLYDNTINAKLYNFPVYRDAGFIINGRADKDQFNGTWDFKEVYGTGSFTSVRTY